MTSAPESTATETSADEPGPEDDVEMGFFDHLAELRKRLINIALGLVVPVFTAFYFRVEILWWLKKPLVDAYAKRGLVAKLHFSTPIDAMVAYLELSVAIGLVVAAPWIFWQIWQFVAPGLYRHERKMVLPFIVGTGFFFIGGAFFGYVVVFPTFFEFLLDFNEGLEDNLLIGDFVSFSTRMLVAFGCVFEVPVVTTLLSILGIVDWKQLLAFGRWWVVIASIVAAILTPPDPMSQMLMMIPLIVLYFLSVGVAYFIGKKPEAEAPPEEPEVGAGP
jgi:sec-independent protein translocase protein TatC